MDISLQDENLFRYICKDSASHLCIDLDKKLKKFSVAEFGTIVNTALLCIAKEGASKCLSALLKHQKLRACINIDQLDEDGNSALLLAAKHNHIELAFMLLHTNISITIRNDKGETALDFACEKGIISLSDALTPSDTDDCSNRYGTQIRILKNKKYLYTALIKAVDGEQSKILELLIGKGVEVNMNVDDDIGTALHCAAENGSLQLVKMLLNAGADIEAIRPCHKQTPLMLACQYGHMDVVQTLLEAGTQFDRQTSKCSTALTLACHYGFEDVATCLLEQGADPSITNKWGFTSLYMSTDSPRILAKVLHHSNVDVNQACGDRLETPLHLVAVIGCVESFQLLIDSGANIDCLTKYMESPLWLAIWKHHTDIAMLCIQLNCRDIINLPSNGCEVYAWKYTPLELALGSGQLDVAILLHYAGAKWSNLAYSNVKNEREGDISHDLQDVPKWIRLRKEVLQYVLTNANILDWFRNCCYNPRSLINICVIAIRECINSCNVMFHMKIERLPIPAKLKMALKLHVII